MYIYINAVANPQSNVKVESYNRPILNVFNNLMKKTVTIKSAKFNGVSSEIMFSISISGDADPILSERRPDTACIDVSER